MRTVKLRSARNAFAVVGLAPLLGLLSPALVQAAGPWKAQVVDAETGQPLEEVVVLMYWIKYTGSWAGWAGGEFDDAEEVVTVADGRFVVPSRRAVTLAAGRKGCRALAGYNSAYTTFDLSAGAQAG